MNLSELQRPSSWKAFSRKLIAKIENPRGVGIYSQEDAEARGMRLVIGEAGLKKNGAVIRFYCLVDKEDGQIVDVRYQVFGAPALLGAAEAAVDILVGKNYDQAKRMTSDLIDLSVREKEGVEAFPKDSYPLLNLTLEAIDQAASQCTDLPLPDKYLSIPVPSGLPQVGGEEYPGWKELPLKKKLAVIEEVLDKEIRPYIALDAGGVEVINLIEGKEVVITYQGSCTSCYSSVGTTLSYIQQILRAKVSPEIIVTPNVDEAQFK